MHEQTVQTKLAHFPLLRQPAPDQEEEAEQAGLSTVQREPAVQLSCRVGDNSCAGAHAETLSRTTVQTAPDTMLRLQRRYGNRFVQRVVTLFRQGEGEADVAPEVEQTIQSARGAGQPLDSTVRAQMEPAFGANFGGVRFHTNHQADGLNHALSARAFTTGQDIFFKQGEYRPGTSGGRELLAHELTHVVQQNGDQVQTKLTVGAPGDRYEQEADQVARTIVQREGMSAQRQVEPNEEQEEPIQTKPQDGLLQQQIEDEKKEEDLLQMKHDAHVQRQFEDEEEKGMPE
jgi:hypothetical protein